MPPVVALTNGCFDIFHHGHAALLSWGASLGDRIIVAVDDDDAVRRLKGPGHPVIGLADRMGIIQRLTLCDVQAFDGNVPALIDRIRPDIYFKGTDPHRKPGAPIPHAQHVLQYGGAVRQMPEHLCPALHTSDIISRCRHLPADAIA